MKKNFNKLDEAGMSICAENVAWAVANKAAWALIGAAKTQHADNIQQVERPKFENVLLVDGVREQLTIAANLVNGAELESISTNLIEFELDKQIEGAFIIESKQLTRIDNTDFSDPAITDLVNELGVKFIDQPDVVISDVELVDLKKTLSDAGIADLLQIRKDANQKEQVATRCLRMKSDAKKSLILACDSRKEYRDIIEYFARCITNAPDAKNAISGDGDVTDYLEARQSAVNTRLKSLRRNSTMVDGEWKNRYDKNTGYPDTEVISELNGHFTILLASAIKAGIDVSKIEKLPSQAQVDDVVAKIRSA